MMGVGDGWFRLVAAVVVVVEAVAAVAAVAVVAVVEVVEVVAVVVVVVVLVVDRFLFFESFFVSCFAPLHFQHTGVNPKPGASNSLLVEALVVLVTSEDNMV
jgi:hypothetical protein